MGIEFMSDAKKMEQAGSMKEDKMPKGFVILLYSKPWLFVAYLASSLTDKCISLLHLLKARLHHCSLLIRYSSVQQWDEGILCSLSWACLREHPGLCIFMNSLLN